MLDGWPARILMVISVPFGIALLLVAIALTWRLWSQTMGVSGQVQPVSQAMASAPPGSAASAVSAPKAPVQTSAIVQGGDEKDSLSNAMAAVGTAVAVLALLLTLGTTWFANVLNKVNDELAILDARDRDHEQSLQLGAALLRAKRELSMRLADKVRDGLDLFSYWSISLEALSSDDSQLRFEAFNELSTALRAYALDLPEISRYCSMCHERALARLQRKAHGELRSPGEIQSLVDEGLWCRLFDPTELDRLRRVMQALPK
jgi:hypothetical protein